MKCNQLSKPEVREPRKQNSIDDRMEKKELGRNKAQSGGGGGGGVVIMCKRLVRSCPNGHLGDEVFTGDLSLGLI